MHLTTIEEIKDYGSVFSNPEGFESNVDANEILGTIESNLNGDMREIYLKIKNGCKVSKSESDKLFNYIKNHILKPKNNE